MTPHLAEIPIRYPEWHVHRCRGNINQCQIIGKHIIREIVSFELGKEI